jgi:tyrosyl-tRNA synthetase
VGITDAPENMFGKLMSISDELMWRYFEVLNTYSHEDIQALKKRVEQGENPRDIKIAFAEKLVTQYHNETQAKDAHASFVRRFQQKHIPENLETQTITINEQSLGIAYLLKDVNLVKSTSEALRMIQQGAVKVDGQRMLDTKRLIKKGDVHIYQVGKRRIAKVKLI